jgi:hypothetical protein
MVFSEACAAESNKFVEQQLEQARAARMERLKLGADATKVLASSDAAAQAKTNAALAIGQLGYIPGIPVLIKHIDVKNPQQLSCEEDIGSLWPCVRALADLGVAAVPALVRAFAIEMEKDRRKLLHDAILYGKAYFEAKTYTQGLLSQTNDQAQRKALEELLKLIPEEEKADKKK